MNGAATAPLGRLLIVDDETTLVTALVTMLREGGYQAKGATTPGEALEIIRQREVDVMLTDLHLPEMDGLALLRAALEIDPALIVIMMTGFGTIDTAVDAMKAGAVDYIVKPFNLKSVLAVLARALAVRRLRQENEALQRRLASRTQELEAANKELEAFSYSVSHDLRAPLRAVEGFTECLIEDAEKGIKDNLQDYGRRIKRGVNRMTSMIDDLLRMAKTMRVELNRAEVDLAPLAHDIMARFRAESPERKLELTVAEQMIVHGDPGLLQLVMENLLSNAWKYTSRRTTASIEVGMRRVGDETVIFVRDNGVGFDVAEVQHLFAPFRRLQSAVDFSGTGIGLATVHRIIQRHGGRIWADAVLGQGATFSFSLPENMDAGASYNISHAQVGQRA
jgi:signal transduction histidine kinase